MNTVNPAALFRSLVVYAVCVPLAITAGYLLTNPTDYESLGFVGVLAAVLVFPLLMKWHYPLLVFSWGCPIYLFFVPSHPSLFMFMVFVSLGITIVERILDRSRTFLPAGPVRWPLFALLAVVIITAELTGGIGLRTFGGDTYGGKKYLTIITGVLSYFAVIARPIPKKQANLYLLLYFGGSFLNCMPDLYGIIPGLQVLLGHIIPGSSTLMDESGHLSIQLGNSRLGALASAAGGVFLWMLARHGLRGCFFSPKPWRPVGMGLMLVTIMLGGYRNSLLGVVLVLVVLFFMERLYRTRAMLIVVLGGILGGPLLLLTAAHLPYTIQRSLAFLPLTLDPMVREDATGSSEWRLEIWRAVLPQVPKYLLLGKGYSFSAQTYSDSMGANATFKKIIDAADNPLALSSDFHSGPLSVVIPFGIWGVLCYSWFWGAGWHILRRNYRYGDPALLSINRYLFVWYMCSIFRFVFVFGDAGAVGDFAGLIGLSVAFNHGVMGPRSFPRPNPATRPSGHPAFAPRPA